MTSVALKACDKCGQPGHMLINRGPNSWTMTSTVYCYSCMCDQFPTAVNAIGGVDFGRYISREIRF